MKQSSERLNRIIKKIMITVSLILAVFLSLKEATQAAGRLDLKRFKAGSERALQRAPP